MIFQPGTDNVDKISDPGMGSQVYGMLVLWISVLAVPLTLATLHTHKLPRPKKEQKPDAVEAGNIPVTRKRGNPDYQVSSYYIPKGLNLKFDRAVLALKAAGFETDKSDVLSALISRFIIQVDVAEKAATIEKGMNLKSILDAAGEGSLGETAEVSVLKDQLKSTISSVEKAGEDYQNSSITLADGQDLEDRFSQIDSRFSEIESLLKKLVDQLE